MFGLFKDLTLLGLELVGEVVVKPVVAVTRSTVDECSEFVEEAKEIIEEMFEE